MQKDDFSSAVCSENFTIVKRDGRLVPFNKERIKKALDSAFRDTKKLIPSEPLPTETTQSIEKVCQLVHKQVTQENYKGTLLTVEAIQDLVEIKLMEAGHLDVARDYILYREQHKILREDSPRNLKILRRDESTVRFNPMKIAAALELGFRDTFKIKNETPQEIIDAITLLTKQVVDEAMKMSKSQEILHVENIQDIIEQKLMLSGYFAVAKDFILFRAERSWQRENKSQEENEKGEPSSTNEKEQLFTITKADGTTYTLSRKKIREKLSFACKGYEKLVSVDELLEQSLSNFYEGMRESEVDMANMMAARAKVEIEPTYTYVASRLLLDLIYRETMGIEAHDPQLKKRLKNYFREYLTNAVSLGRLDPQLLSFNLEKLADALDIQRDHKFNYLGLQTLYDRYFIHDKGRRLESPQLFWMRVAMGLALNEGKEKEKRAIEFYNVFSKFLYVSSTPTLFNAGTLHSQLSSCFLSTVMDDLAHIYKVISDDAQLSKWAGGLGNDWSNIRATGASIKGTNGHSQGVIPFLKVANDTAVAVNQCFAPETRIFTAEGIKQIADISIGELVLGMSGTYREVTNKFIYNQKDPMVSIDIKHSLEPIHVTTAHPFYAIQGIPMGQANKRTLNWLDKGKVRAAWVDASNLKPGDYIAQVIPKESVVVPAFTEEDARLYGILLGDGHMSKDGMQWGVSGNPQVDDHLEFVRNYLNSRNIHFWETKRGDTYFQIHWALGRGAVQDATTGRFVSAGEPTLPFEYDDLYDSKKCKHIAPRFAHLPKPQALALLQGLLETDGNVSRGKEITFSNTSLPLVEGIRYQCLRFGVPTAGNRRVRTNNHTARRSDGSTTEFKGQTISYDLRIPAFNELADKIDVPAVTKQNWITADGFVWSRVTQVQPMAQTFSVCDLEVDADESYMTTSGLAHNGGKRKGAMCAYLESWHLDMEEFLELRKNTGDERRRTHDMNTANWIPDLFMKRVIAGSHWTLFSPNDVPDLHHLYGQEFERRYEEYEKRTENGQITLFKKVDALGLWRKMLGMLFETGHPWITFKDPSNIRAAQDHVGVVHSSNLCTEILLNTSEQETAVCNLGSINLNEHVTEKGIDEALLAQTIHTAIRMLDNVIDINFYPIPETKNANLRHRPIGLGLMGFQDALYKLDFSYASHEAIAFADKSMELISYHAILASSLLAKERGSYSSYKGSKWDRGILPIDSLALLEKERGAHFVEVNKECHLDWTPVRESIKKYGMRNSHTMAIAPTATIANITGVTQSIEPMYKHLFVKSNLSGEFTVANTYLVEDLKKLGLWDAEMLDDLKYFDGSILEIERIPDEIKQKYLTAFEIDPDWIIACGSRRQKWIDMGQSLNLYLSKPSGKKLHDMYMSAWKRGLKTTYYLRSTGATQIEKSTTDINKRGLQPRWMKNASASSRIEVQRGEPAPIACSMEEGCESCQ